MREKKWLYFKVRKGRHARSVNEAMKCTESQVRGNGKQNNNFDLSKFHFFFYFSHQ